MAGQDVGKDGSNDPQRPLTASGLCDEYADRVYRFAAIVAKGDVEADDLAHDTLVRAIRSVHQYDPRRGSIEAWLWRIVVNQAKDTARISARRLQLWTRLVQDSASAESAESSALDRLTVSELLSVIRRLPALDRQLLALRFGAQLTFKEIGEAIGASEAAVGAATRRAIAKLRRKLEATSR